MRSVRIVVRQVAGSVPALVAASVLSATACGDTKHEGGGMFSGGTATGGSDAGAGGRAVVSFGGTPSTGGGPMLTPGGQGQLPDYCNDYQVLLPDAGTPAVAGEICAVSLEPVLSPGAAIVSLEIGATPQSAVNGTLTLSKDLRDSVLGAPAVTIATATENLLLEAQLSELTETPQGYSFKLTWPKGVQLRPNDMTRVTFRTALDVKCEAGGSRLVHALTDVHLCGGSEGVPEAWASVGERCVVCNIIAEVAASPIIPDHAKSGLPLGQALRARIVELAKVGASVVLFAENDGGSGTDYEWHVSGGVLEHMAPDVVIFRADGSAEPSVQVAIVAEEGVAVVSYAYGGGAH